MLYFTMTKYRVTRKILKLLKYKLHKKEVKLKDNNNEFHIAQLNFITYIYFRNSIKFVRLLLNKKKLFYFTKNN